MDRLPQADCICRAAVAHGRKERHIPLEVHQSLSSFVRANNLEDASEPELLWAFTNSHNSPPPEGHNKTILSMATRALLLTTRSHWHHEWLLSWPLRSAHYRLLA